NHGQIGSQPERVVSFLFAKNNRSKSVCTLFQRKRLSNQTVWLVIFGLTGAICARALKSFHLLELRPRGHHDWPVKPTIRSPREACEFRTRCHEARPGDHSRGVEIRPSSSEGAVPRSRSVNPTRLTCRNEPDSDDLCRDGAFISDDVHVV